MNRPNIVFTLLIAVSLLAGSSKAQAADQPSLPHIVFILADDMGYGDAGCYNPQSKIPTPNIDRLAREGLRFTDMHSPSSVCTPTRYGILTGRYCWRSRLPRGVLNGYGRYLIEPDRLTVASLLKRKGYRTACVGKWHLGMQAWADNDPAQPTDYTRPLSPGPNSTGFDYYFGIPASLDMAPYLFVENDRALGELTETIPDSIPPDVRLYAGAYYRGGPIVPGFKLEEVLPRFTEKAVEQIEEHSREHKNQALFLYLPLSAPHTPWLPLDDYRGKSEAGEYGDFTNQVDDSIGRVLEALDRTGMAQNTLVIFSSDNGAYWVEDEITQFNHRANHHLRGQKADIWEGGHRIPFIARWPGRIKAQSVTATVACQTDLLATCADIVSESLPSNAGEDSVSLLPVLLGAATKLDRPAVVHHSARGKFSIRRGDWKLITSRGSGGFTFPKHYEPNPGEAKGQLYHLGEDPKESRNLYLDRPEIVRELNTLLQGFQEDGRSRPN